VRYFYWFTIGKHGRYNFKDIDISVQDIERAVYSYLLRFL